MNHHKKCALSIIAVIFISVCLLQTMSTVTDIANSQRVRNLPSTKIIEHLKQLIDKLGISLDRLWCKTVNIGSTGGFCLSEHNIYVGGNYIWDVKLCRALESLFGNTSVADFGAGLGHYGRCFLRRKESIFITKNKKQTKIMDDAYIRTMGKLLEEPQVIRSWKGYDGAINVDFLSQGFIKQQDLSITNLWLGSKSDWVLSLEIGEHVPAHYEDIFLDNLVRHGCKGIVLSWALEKQGGHHHVNGRSNVYIKKKMADRGLVNDITAEAHIRKSVEVSWFKNTLMVFRYNDVNSCMNDPEKSQI